MRPYDAITARGERMNFTGSHILSIAQFERQDVEAVFAVADRMEPYAHRRRITRVLEGAILGSMFFEPSTRTRVSFGSASTCWVAKFGKRPVSKIQRLPRASRSTTQRAFSLVTQMSS